jgi:hypothetical protein
VRLSEDQQAEAAAIAAPLVRAGVDVVTAVREALRRVAPGPSPYQAHVMAIEDAVMAQTSGRRR